MIYKGWPPKMAQSLLTPTQGSAATHLRCGGIFSDDVITNFLPIPRVKEF